MTDMIEFDPGKIQSVSQLKNCLKDLQAQIAELDKHEPRNMDSEEYDRWADAHEDLEDMVDEILDRLDALDT